ncbi:MAG: hypothetical protein ACR2QW_18445 [bacterium]
MIRSTSSLSLAPAPVKQSTLLCVEGVCKNRLKILWCLILMLFSSSSIEAASVKFIIEDRGQVVNQTAQIADTTIFVKATGGDPQRDLMFDARRDILYLIEHRDRSFLQIDNQTIDEVAALVDSVSGVVESQQGVLSDLLSTFGIDGEPEKPAAALRDSGRQLSIGGYPCQLHQAHVDSDLQFEICVAGNQTLNLLPEDFTTLRKFLIFSNRLQSRAGKLLTVLGLSLPRMDLMKTEELPIGLHAPAKGLKVRVTSIDPEVSPSTQSIPPGYTRSTIPLLSG